MNRSVITYIVSFLLFVAGVALFYKGLTDEWYLSLLPALLYLWAAYGLLRHFRSARYAMYILAIIFAGSLIFVAYYFDQLPAEGVLGMVLVLAATAFVHFHFNHPVQQQIITRSRRREAGFILGYCAAILTILFAVAILEGPQVRIKTLSGPIYKVVPE